MIVLRRYRGLLGTTAGFMALPRQYRGPLGLHFVAFGPLQFVGLAWAGLAWPGGLGWPGLSWLGWLHLAWLDFYRVLWPGLIYRATADFRHRLPRYRPLRYTAYRATGGLR